MAVTRVGWGYGSGSGAHHNAGGVGRAGLYAFTSSGDIEAQNFAQELGAVGVVPISRHRRCWTGRSFSLQWVRWCCGTSPVSAAAVVRRHPYESDTELPHEILWGERGAVGRQSHACRWRGISSLAPKACQTRPVAYKLDQANQALDDLRAGRRRARRCYNRRRGALTPRDPRLACGSLYAAKHPDG